MNYADIVTPEEMAMARAWMARTLRGFSGGRRPGGRAEVRCVRQGWGEFKVGWSMVDGPLRLGGRSFESGFGTHADSEIGVTLSRPGARLTGFAGVDDNWSTREHPDARILFSVEVRGKPVWATERMTQRSKAARIDLDLRGATRFTLLTLAPEGIGRAHATWAGLIVTFDDGSRAVLGERRGFASGPCFSFTFAGRGSEELLRGWKLRRGRPVVRDGVRARRLVWTDPKTSLTCALELKQYLDFPVVEWVLRFRNAGRKPSPILQDIRSMRLRFDPGLDMFLNYQDGDYCVPESYQPHRLKLSPGTTLDLAPEGGRPTNKAYPYFNLEVPGEKRGVIAVVGWPGQWSAQFSATTEERCVVAGQERTHFRLMPGEEVRTPMSVLMFWTGDRVRSQNLWRRWMLAHNVPRPGGRLPEPLFSTCMGLWQNEAGEKACIDAFLAHGVRFDYWWMDAGWYPSKTRSWPAVGTWEPDRERFPNGIRAVSDYAHRRGMKFVLWFEPERVTEGSWLDANHPEWLLSCREDSNKLLDLGNAGAWRWLVKHIDAFLRREGVDLYRQDHNFNPLPYWRAHDAPDRQGITEIRHVEGYLAFWDELRRRRPDVLIDSCASGGRRNDLETLRRGVPLLRSDYQYVFVGDADEYAAGNQGHTWGLAQWVPYYGSGVAMKPAHTARSHYCPAFGLGGGDPRDPGFDRAQFKRIAGDWRRIAPYFAGDFYPLTSYSIEPDAWMAWQFHRPDLGAGMVQAFRHSKSPFVRAAFHLSGLDVRATYVVTDLDRPKCTLRRSGRALMGQGLDVVLADAPGSAIVVYEKRGRK